MSGGAPSNNNMRGPQPGGAGGYTYGGGQAPQYQQRPGQGQYQYQQGPGQMQYQPAGGGRKKGPPVGLIIAIVLAVLVAGALLVTMVILPAATGTRYMPGLESFPDPTERVLPTIAPPTVTFPAEDDSGADEPAVDEPNSAYTEIFSSRNIVDSPVFFLTPESSDYAAVMASENGEIIDKMALGFEDDLVKEMAEVTYIPISGFTQEELETFDSTMRENYAALTSEAFCTADFAMTENYYVTTFQFKDLDVPENVQKLAEYGFVTQQDVTAISAEVTEQSLLGSGYVKK